MTRGQIAAVMLALAVALTACTTESATDEPMTSTSTGLPTTSIAPTAPEFGFAPAAVWTSPTVDSLGLAFAGDLLLTSSSSPEDRLTVVDLTTGSTVWSLGELAELDGTNGAVLWSDSPLLSDDGSEPVILVGYFGTECEQAMCPPGTVDNTDERGVAALSVADGTVQWTVPIIPAVPVDSDEADQLDDQTMVLKLAGPEVAIVVAGPRDGVLGNKVVDPAEIVTIALDPRTGAERWRTTASFPRAIAGEVLLSSIPPAGPVGTTIDGVGTPIAYDLTTGETLWDLAETYPEAEFAAASDQVGAWWHIEDGKLGAAMVRLSDGVVLEIQDSYDSCAADPALLVCEVHDKPLGATSYLWSAGADAVPVLTGIDLDGGVNDVYGDYVFAGYGILGKAENAYDRAGNMLSDDLPGSVLAISDDYIAFRTNQGTLEFSASVYRRN